MSEESLEHYSGGTLYAKYLLLYTTILSFLHLTAAFQKALKLPGSKKDVVRTKLVSGPSPVGGSAGGTESTSVQTLDEFELQAAHYNMACAYAKLENAPEVSLK